MSRFALFVLLASHFARAAAVVPPAYRAILSKHALDAERLKALGWIFSGERCVPASSPDGSVSVAPEQLDALLAALDAPRPVAAAARAKPLELPRLELTSYGSAGDLDRIFDASRRGASSGAVPAPAKPAPQEQPAAEAPFAGPFAKIEKDLKDSKRRARALKALSAHFIKDEDSETGLGPDAPEALRLLTCAIAQGQGGPGAAVELRRELALVAMLKPEQKPRLVSRLTSPATMFVALSRSHAPHALDARLYFARMLELLGARSLTDFLSEQDPDRRYSANFLLRALAYDALIPYLNRRPAQAAEIAPILFPDERPREIAGRADQLEGLLTQLCATSRPSGALDRFAAALEERAKAGGPSAAAIAAFLKINEPLLPSRLKPGVDALSPLLPPDVLEEAGLLPDTPYDHWPSDRWKFVLHFADPGAFQAWRGRFEARGYKLDSTTQGISLAKDFGGLKVALEAKLYAGDDDSFLNGAEAKRYLGDVSRELRDPSVQGVILRNHAQFKIANLFRKGVKNKLLIDGACRSAWDLAALRRLCPSCYFVVNTGSGIGRINNDAVIAVVEGLAAKKEWDEVGAEFSRVSKSSSSRMQGPWTPDYAAALKALAAASKKK